MKARVHNIGEIPEGKTLGEIAPAFADVTHEIHVGKTNDKCAGCRRPFHETRRPHSAIRLFPVNAPIPIAFSYNLCRTCTRRLQRGGKDREAVLAAVDLFHNGITPGDGQ